LAVLVRQAPLSEVFLGLNAHLMGGREALH